MEADSREVGRLLGLRTSGLPPPWVERFSKLGIEGSSRTGRAEDTNCPSPRSEPWPSPEPPCHTAAPCCFSRAALTSLGASFLTCTSQCPAEERAAAVAVEREPCSVAECALAVPSAGLPLCSPGAPLWREAGKGMIPQGTGVQGILGLQSQSPGWGKERISGAVPQSRGSCPHQIRCLCWILNLFVLRPYFSHWTPALPQPSAEPLLLPESLFLYGVLSPPCVPIF